MSVRGEQPGRPEPARKRRLPITFGRIAAHRIADRRRSGCGRDRARLHPRPQLTSRRREHDGVDSASRAARAGDRRDRSSRHRERSHPRLPRDQRAARRKLGASCSVRAERRVLEPDAVPEDQRVARGDARPGAGLLVARYVARTRQADRDHLRQRLRLPLHERPARPERTRLGGRREPPGDGSPAIGGRPDRYADSRSDHRGLGARHPGSRPHRPDHARPCRGSPTTSPRPGRCCRAITAPT